MSHPGSEIKAGLKTHVIVEKTCLIEIDVVVKCGVKEGKICQHVRYEPYSIVSDVWDASCVSSSARSALHFGCRAQEPVGFRVVWSYVVAVEAIIYISRSASSSTS